MTKKLQGRPKTPEREKLKQVCIYLTDGQKKAIQKKYRNVSNAVREAILEKL